MLPTKWGYEFNKPTDTIKWSNSDYTFQSTVSFPAPRHNYLPYFETFITSMTGTVAIGVGIANTKGEKLLPGWKAGSYGYHADDGRVFIEEGKGKDYGPTYNVGDVIGCGISMNNELFFTKNGKHLGVACVLPKGKFFPVIGLDKASISTNFGKSPFLFDPFRATSSSIAFDFKNVSESTLMHILSFLDLKNLSRFGRTSKGNFRESVNNQLWKPLVYKKWSTVSSSVPIASFYQFYKIREARIEASGTKDPTLIENCFEWEFKCPVALNKIQRTHDNEVDFCSVCKKEVYLVHNKYELEQRVKQQQCVAIDFDNKEQSARNKPKFTGMIMGRMRAPQTRR